jgi:hypothetical protein
MPGAPARNRLDAPYASRLLGAMVPTPPPLTPAQQAAAARATARAQAEARALRENLTKRKIQARSAVHDRARSAVQDKARSAVQDSARSAVHDCTTQKRTDDAGHA